MPSQTVTPGNHSLLSLRNEDPYEIQMAEKTTFVRVVVVISLLYTGICVFVRFVWF